MDLRLLVVKLRHGLWQSYSSFVMLKFQDSMLTQESKVVQNQILHWVKPCTDVIGGKKNVK